MKNDGLSLNVRLLAVLLVGGMVACVGVFFLNRFQVKRHSRFFLDEARSGVANLPLVQDPLDKMEKIKAIGLNYTRYLIHNKDDREIESEFALMYADSGESLIETAADENDTSKRQKIIHSGLVLYDNAIARLEKILRDENDDPKLRAKLVDLFFKRGNWSGAIEHIKFLVAPPADAKGLAKLFDRFDLWKRISPPVPDNQDPQMSLARFLTDDNQAVDREKLLAFLEDDLWMILDDAKLLKTYGRCQTIREKNVVAEKSLEQAIAHSPDDPELYEQLAFILRAIDPPRPADADYWINEMVAANPASYSARLKRARYWNKLATRNDVDERELLTKNAVRDALGGMQKAITIIADEADRQSPSLPETKALKAALEKLPTQPPATNELLTSSYQNALLGANKAALALGGKLKGISEELDACRDGLLLAAQSELMICWRKKDHSKEALKDALRYAQSFTSLFPKYPPGYSVLSEINQLSGDSKAAIASLRAGSEACEDNTNLLWRLAALLIDSGRIDDAKLVCRKIEDSDADQFAVDHIEAHIAYSQGRWQEAAEGFEAVRDEASRRWPSQAKSLDFLLAQCYGRLGRLDKQQDAYFRAASSDRTWLPALIGIAETKAKSGQIDGAIGDYRRILKLHNAPLSTAFELARLLHTKNLRQPKAERNWEEIEALIELLRNTNSKPLQVALLQADIYFSQGDDVKATAILNAAQKQFEEEHELLQPQLEVAKRKAASLLGHEQEDARAEVGKLSFALRKNAANQAGIWTALVKVAKRKKDWKAAENAFLEARKMVGDTAGLRLTHGEYLLARMGEKAAEPLRSLAGSTKNFSKASRLHLWRGLAGLSLRAGDYKQAKLLSQGVLNDEPGNREMQIVSFEIAVREKDFQEMEKVLDEIKKDEKKPGAFWHYGQAVLLNMSAKDNDTQLLNQAQSHLQKALQIRANWMAARVLDATLYDRQGNAEAAVESYRKAIDLGGQSTRLIRRTVQLLAKLNRFREADEVLRLLGERQDSVTGDSDYETSIVKAQIGKYEDALVFARKVAADSNKASDHVWLGQLLSILGRQANNQQRQEDADRDLKEAEKAFEKAVRLDPANDIAWVAMIQFYGQTEQIQKAEAAIAEAQSKLPPKKVASAIAQCYEAIGKKQDAEKLLLATAAKSPHDAAAVERVADYYMRNNQIGKAVEQLKKIIDGDVRADDDQQSKARRSYATILFSRGGESNRKKALELIEKNLRLNSSSQDDQYAKAVLLASDLSPAQRKRAIPTLEKLLAAQRSPSSEIQFTLAKLYLSEEQLTDFKNLMRNILSGRGQEPRYLAFYADTLIERDEIQEAGIYLDMLHKTLPDSIVTHKLAAKHAFKQGLYETTINILKTFLDTPQADKQKQMLYLVDIANALAGFATILKEGGRGQDAIAKGFDDEAQSIYRKFVDMQVGRELLMAQFLAKQGHLKSAIKLVQQHASQSSAGDIAKTCFYFLQGTEPNSEQLRQIDRILKDALRKYASGQDAIILKTAMAVLRDFQGRDTETESIYREILRGKPDDPTAMNNLAVFMALHKRNLNEAQELINKAIHAHGRIPGLLDTRALVYLAQNKPKRALDDLSLALNNQPTPVRYFHQAQAYFQDGQKEAAVKALAKARKMGLKETSMMGIERRNYQKLVITLR